MSGFVCIVNLDGAPIDALLLQRMTSFMTFRGPDAQHTWSNTSVGFGHTLLRTVFEQDHEQQPCSLDGRVWITGDVRLDARTELLRKLRGQGQDVANGAPDVELLLHAYEVWGETCLEHLIGDFSFAVWDGPHRRLFCARDQFGVAPFYYAQVGQSLLISNTLNCLKLHPGISDRINEQALGDFLVYGMNYDPGATTFTDIKRLPPAHSLTWSGGRPQSRRYWELPKQSDYVQRRPEDCVEQFRELFDQAVGDRLRTARVSTHLSGGMDSSSIAVTAQQLLTAEKVTFDLRAFTAVADTLLPDKEGVYAQQIAARSKLQLEFVSVEDCITRTPQDTPEYVFPEPVAIFEINAMAEIHLRAAQHSRVLLNGFGGDPLFTASNSYWLNSLRRGRLDLWFRGIQQYRQVYGRRPHLGLRAQLPVSSQKIKDWWPLPSWLNGSFADRVNLPERHQEFCRGWYGHDQQRGMANDLFWSNMFAWSDPGFTSLPLKSRFPFFDMRLLRYVLSVPPVVWINDKRLLRAAMSDRLPESVLQRPKSPLAGHPEVVLATSEGTPQWVLNLAGSPELAEYVKPQALTEILGRPENATAVRYNEVMSGPLTLAHWLRNRRLSGTNVFKVDNTSSRPPSSLVGTVVNRTRAMERV